MQVYEYNIEKYNFISMLEGLFKRTNLQTIHEDLNEQYEIFNEPGKDSDTQFHTIFYDKMRSGWPEFILTYKKFIKEVVVPIYGSPDELIYQKWPSFRVHLPNNMAVGGWHNDGDYNHPAGETNFIVAITPMFESNTVIMETSPGKKDFRQLEMKPGQLASFNGNKCTHGNLPNRTGVSRISFDFRVMKMEDYNSSHELKSLSKGSKFIIGEYYEVMELK